MLLLFAVNKHLLDLPTDPIQHCFSALLYITNEQRLCSKFVDQLIPVEWIIVFVSQLIYNVTCVKNIKQVHHSFQTIALERFQQKNWQNKFNQFFINFKFNVFNIFVFFFEGWVGEEVTLCLIIAHSTLRLTLGEL